MKAVCALSPKSDNFLSLATLQPFLDHSLPPLDNIQNEISIFRNYLSQNPTSDNESQGLHSLTDCIKPVQEAFPILSNCIQVALTIGISTATVERSFSCLRRLKTYLRSTMTEERLDSLALLYIERDISAKLWNSMDDLVVQFAQKHLNSRIVLL